jgi:hypothetical protein
MSIEHAIKALGLLVESLPPEEKAKYDEAYAKAAALIDSDGGVSMLVAACVGLEAASKIAKEW